MGRPSGTKNVMRTPEEKEKLVLEYLNSKEGYRRIAENNDVYPSIFLKWIKLYREQGIDGLKSKQGKTGIGKGNFKRSEIEQLKEELLKKDIEIARLKKGYNVKGVGQEKEFITTFNKNIK